MANDRFLELNPFKAIDCLAGILSARHLEAIRQEAFSHARKMVNLAHAHLRLAKRFRGNASWRQKVSRAYHACYIASRAVRFTVCGVYDTSPADHKNVGKLPRDFPDLSNWQEFLTRLRADRNMSDYDHIATKRQLELPLEEYLEGATGFVLAAKGYLRQKGILS